MDNKFIGLSVPNLVGNELKYVTEAVESEWVSTAGSFVGKFEDAIANYVNVPNAVACQSGTAGIHTALIVNHIGMGDMVIVPTLTFIAAVNPVSYVGAEPAFMDCDDSLCIDSRKVREFCLNECDFDGKKLIHKKSRKHVKAMIVVHVFGNMADMESLVKVASDYNIKIIEDATEALGTYYTAGKYAGCYAGTMGDIGVYSFNGNKIITTGGGGMIVSNDDELLRYAKHLTTQAKADEKKFIHDEIGYNYRMTNVQAAIGVAQLEQLETFIDRKHYNYSKYKELLSGLDGVSIIPFREGIRSNKWFYSMCLTKEMSGKRDALMGYLKNESIQTRPVWGLIHEQKPYIQSVSYMIEKAVDYWKCIINLPCSTNLSEDDVVIVANAIRNYFN